MRISLSKALGGLILVTLLFSHKMLMNSITGNFMVFTGFILASLAMAGRIWCSLIITGKKNSSLVTTGPYSICRNPLYLFSFIGAVGVGLSTGSVMITLFILLFMVIYYPGVIMGEEKILADLHKQDYESYCKKVPRFFPDLSLLNEPDEYVFKPEIFLKAAKDAIWFIWIPAVFQLISYIGTLNILPVSISIL
jgi:protein-S-isoprenylcysteine O-methyltransferase Ste14